jgi:hypothetical protein
MRDFATLVVALAIIVAATSARAQTSVATTCLMTCNSQAANCQTGCVVPSLQPANTGSVINGGTCLLNCNSAQPGNCQIPCQGIPPAAAAMTSNTAATTTCLLSCSSTLLTCQTNCGRQSP